jgi:hypothetical protein
MLVTSTVKYTYYIYPYTQVSKIIIIEGNIFYKENKFISIKSCSDKCTLFIICYLIQFILKIVQHVSNGVSSSSGTQ